MRKNLRLTMALLLAGTWAGVSLAAATPASACTGDPCDGFCITYASLPPVIQQKVFHSSSCPIQ